MTRNGAMRVLRAGRQRLRGSVLSTLTGVALILVIGVLGVVTYWHHHVETGNTEAVLEARRMSALYIKVNNAARRAELLIAVGNATGDPQYIVQQAAVEGELDATFDAISAAPGAEDRRFGEWAKQYIAPIKDVFARLQDDPPPPFAELERDYAAAYIALYRSVEAGDLGDPALVGQLVD
ncbi:MAG: hypothetical protein IH609_12280, partial [Dehalococcoidia bacterium]|nr:hypothetical protein [Dehalococcoidia bacterium]